MEVSTSVASEDELQALASAVKAELAHPSQERGRLIKDVGGRLMGLTGDCLEPSRIDTLLEVGQLAYFEGRSVDGLHMVKSAAALATRAQDIALLRKALTYEAALHGDLGDTPTAFESTAGAIVLARQIGNEKSEATLWCNLGALLSQAGDWRGGLRASARALEFDPLSNSALVNAAEACLELGNVVKGLRFARKCVDSTVDRGKLQQLATLAQADLRPFVT